MLVGLAGVVLLIQDLIDQELANYGRQRQSYSQCPQARNHFYIFKGKKQRRFNRDNMWLARPKVFTIWPFSEGLLTPRANP